MFDITSEERQRQSAISGENEPMALSGMCDENSPSADQIVWHRMLKGQASS